jgi:hypothetical protein
MRHLLPDQSLPRHESVPHDLTPPRPQSPTGTSSLEPSPIEVLRESLKLEAEYPRQLNLPRPQRHERIRSSLPRPDSRSIPHDHRPARERQVPNAIGLSLRPEELQLLREVGRFRVIRTRDLSETVYHNRASRMQRDLAYLRQHGLIEIDSVRSRRDGRRAETRSIEVVTLTREGRHLAQQTLSLPVRQRLYAGLVKPREIEHDSQIYRAFLKEAERIEQAGGCDLWVELDFELKSKIQKAIHAERQLHPEREMDDIKPEVAQAFDLPYVDHVIQIPDARIEYSLDHGSRTGHQDIEVLTAAYHPGHLRHKAQAGFHVYASARDRATLSTKIENDHHLIDNILEL